MFDLFKPGSTLLAMTDQAAMEVHSVTGDVEAFIRLLQAEGFDVNVTRQGHDAIVQCKRKEPRTK